MSAVDGNACKQAREGLGASCRNCIRVCPFAAPDNALLEVVKQLLGA